MSEEHEWYSNKELFEKMSGMTETMQNFQLELIKTQNMMKEYNGLREKVDADRTETAKIREDIDLLKLNMKDLQTNAKARNKVWIGIREWIAWVIGILGFAWAIWSSFK